MSIILEQIRNKLCLRIRLLDKVFDRRLISPISKRRIERYAFQEGMVSALWQAWCAFCRSVLIASASGALSKSGSQITSPYSNLTEMQISYVLRQLAYRNNVAVGASLKGMYQEPVWGDLDKLNLMATGLKSTNSHILTAAFGIGLKLKDLQLCRNASAHVNRDLIREINRARVRYGGSNINHPSDLIFWVDTATSDFVWKTWIDEILAMSDHAIR